MFKFRASPLLSPEDSQDINIIVEFLRGMNINTIHQLPYFGDIEGFLESL